MSTSSGDYAISKEISIDAADFGNVGDKNSYSIISFDGGSGNLILPIPKKFKFENGYEWKSEDTSKVASAVEGYVNKRLLGEEAALEIVGAGVSDFYTRLNNAISNVTSRKGIEMGSNVSQTALKTLGLAENPNKQIFFEGIDLEGMDCEFEVSPTSKEASDRLKSIVKDLINSSSPSFKYGKAFFTYPKLASFTIKLNGVTFFQESGLAITKINVAPSDSRLTWHEDGMPVSLGIEISFKETSLRTKENLSKITFLGQTL